MDSGTSEPPALSLGDRVVDGTGGHQLTGGAATLTAVDHDGLLAWLGFAAGLLHLTYALLFAGLIAIVVQSHSLVGTTAFWFARPIPPPTLLVSKVWLLVVVLILVPTVVDVSTMLRYRIPTLEILQVKLQSALVAGVAAGPFMTGLSVSDLNNHRLAPRTTGCC
ncbi:hypothetical protein BH18ACI5_BH18ACI5_17350 [soil metagenome]